jgi:electron transport complex protein RnfC
MRLHAAIRRLDWADPDLVGLSACTECGDCLPVCPSAIELVADFRYAKAEIAWQRERLARADAARRRFLARRQRLAEEATARSRALAANSANPVASAAAAVDLLQAALARARKKHLATPPVDGGA